MCGVDGVCRSEDLNEGRCDDGDPCTLNDTCVAGTCQGTPNDCSDFDHSDTCFIDGAVCNPRNGVKATQLISLLREQYHYVHHR